MLGSSNEKLQSIISLTENLAKTTKVRCRLHFPSFNYISFFFGIVTYKKGDKLRPAQC